AAAKAHQHQAGGAVGTRCIYQHAVGTAIGVDDIDAGQFVQSSHVKWRRRGMRTSHSALYTILPIGMHPSMRMGSPGAHVTRMSRASRAWRLYSTSRVVNRSLTRRQYVRISCLLALASCTAYLAASTASFWASKRCLRSVMSSFFALSSVKSITSCAYAS